MKKITQLFPVFSIVILASCATLKKTPSLSDEQWEKYSQEAMNLLVAPFAPSEHYAGGYIWPFLTYYPSLPPVITFHRPYPGLVPDDRSFTSLPVKLNGDLKQPFKIYSNLEQFITDTATVIICSPLLSTNQKGHYLVRQYVFHGNPKENARFSRTLTRKFVIKNGVLMLESGDQPFDLDTSADEISFINYDYYCK